MSRPTIVLISGWAHAPSAMNGLAAKLSGYGSVIATSTNELWLRCRDPGAALSCADGLVSLIGDIGASPVVVGWSMGGMVALETAALHSGLVSSLVVVGGTAKFCSDEGYDAGVNARQMQAMLLGLRRDRRSTLSRFLERVAVPGSETGSSLKEKVDEACMSDPRALRQGLVYLQQFDIRSRLGRIGVPVLAVHGRKDRIVPWQAGRLLSEGLPDGRFVLEDDEGHAFPVQNPGRLASEIGRFVGIIRESECR